MIIVTNLLSYSLEVAGSNLESLRKALGRHRIPIAKIFREENGMIKVCLDILTSKITASTEKEQWEKINARLGEIFNMLIRSHRLDTSIFKELPSMV